MEQIEFLCLLVVSFCIFVLIIRVVMGLTEWKRHFKKIILLGLVVVIGGMFFGKFGAHWGLPWWLYYPIPMLITVFLPPFVLKMKRKEIVLYILFSFISAPIIHTLFSLFLGWTNYMPFFKIPSLW